MMNRILLLIVTFSVVALSDLKAQTGTFRMNYNFANIDLPGSMIQNSNNEFIMVGANATLVPVGNITKLNINGDIIWSKGVSAAFGTFLNDVIEVSPANGGGYLAVGNDVLVRMDNNGNLLWGQRINMPNTPSGNSSSVSNNAVIETSDGNFLIAGSVRYFYDGVNTATHDTTNCFAVKVTPTGTVMWDRTIVVDVPNPDEHAFVDVTETSDGYVFVGYSSRGDGPLVGSDNGDYYRYAIIHKTDFNGTEVYTRRFGAADRSEYANAVITTSDGNNFVIAGERGDNGYLLRINAAGATPTINYGHRYSGGFLTSHLFNDVMETSDGNYSILGNRIAALSFSFDATVAKINSSNGSTIFGRAYTSGMSSILPQGGLTANDEYFMFMTAQQFTGFNYHVIKTDNNGNLNNSECPESSYSPSRSDYNPSLDLPTYTIYSDRSSNSAITPAIADLNPTIVEDCRIIVCDEPAAPVLEAHPPQICEGGEATIGVTNAEADVTYSFFTDASGGTAFATGTSTEVSPTETTTYYVEGENDLEPGCTSARVPITITVNPTPDPNISSNSPICVGNDLELSVDGGGTYSWVGPNGFSSGDANPVITNAQTNNSGTYTVTVTSDENCEAEVQIEVEVLEPPVAEITGDAAVCLGEEATLVATGGGAYSWDSGEDTDEITVSPTETTTYTVTVTAGSCSDEASFEVVVNDIPDVTITDDFAICESEETLLSASGGVSYEWSTGETTDEISVSPTETTTYTVTVTGANDCTNEGSVTVMVNEIPEGEIDGILSLCEGESTTLTASGGASYSWDTGEDTAEITVSPSENTTYTVLVTGANNCSIEVSATVEVNPVPEAAISGDGQICEGDETTLVASGGASYSWNNGEDTAEITVSPTETTTYTVTVTSGSCTDEASFQVVVNETPEAGVSDDMIICERDEVTLTATGGGTYEWNTGETTSSINVSPTETTTYTVVVANTFGCTDEASVTVEVNPLPNGQVTGNTSICEGEETTLTASGGVDYLWNTGSMDESITVNPDQTTDYQVHITGANGCILTLDVTVVVNEQPEAAISGVAGMCSNETYTLTATGGTSYVWNTGETSSQINVNVSQNTTFSVEVFIGSCSSVASIEVEAYEAPVASIDGNVSITQLETATLTAQPDGAASYTWSPSEGLSCTECQTTEANPIIATTYCVEVVDFNGCADTSCVEVSVEYICGEVFVPNAFSPNNDGENDCFQVHGNCLTQFSLKIFSRWGELVFETSSQEECWDGTHRGKELNTGVFAYVVSAVHEDGQNIQLKGNVSLIK
jgi:gliding motility-associated-like protein